MKELKHTRISIYNRCRGGGDDKIMGTMRFLYRLNIENLLIHHVLTIEKVEVIERNLNSVILKPLESDSGVNQGDLATPITQANFDIIPDGGGVSAVAYTDGRIKFVFFNSIIEAKEHVAVFLRDIIHNKILTVKKLTKIYESVIKEDTDAEF